MRMFSRTVYHIIRVKEDELDLRRMQIADFARKGQPCKTD